MVLFKYKPTTSDGGMITIYIPIWFYSNIEKYQKIILQELFTFQYGSIQIKITKLVTANCPHLHSNMVLFKCGNWDNNSENDKFTFQYGSIQMCKYLEKYNEESIYIPIWFYSNYIAAKNFLLAKKFTFQYGSIQIK